jgi:outer membrane protein assembly factor BamE
MVDKLKPGMTRRQVAFVMGEPVIQDPFDDTKWVYLYSIDVPGVFSQQSRLVLSFDENDLLAIISGDYAPGASDQETSDTEEAAADKQS